MTHKHAGHLIEYLSVPEVQRHGFLVVLTLPTVTVFERRVVRGHRTRVLHQHPRVNVLEFHRGRRNTQKEMRHHVTQNRVNIGSKLTKSTAKFVNSLNFYLKTLLFATVFDHRKIANS